MTRRRVAQRYVGAEAAQYEANRIGRGRDKWNREFSALRELLQQLVRKGSVARVMDVPVGTGRFFPIYRELGLTVTGYDVSEDMLTHARKRLLTKDQFTLQRADVFNLPPDCMRCDAIVCNRFANWLTFEQLAALIKLFAAAGPKHILIGIRTYPYAHDSDPSTPTQKPRPMDGATLLFRRVWQILRSVGFWALVTKVSRFVYQRYIARPPRLVVHPVIETYELFASAGYSIADRLLIESSPDATALHLYLLERLQ